MNFLAEIMERKRERLAEAKEANPVDIVRQRALEVVQKRSAHAFRSALEDRSQINIIAEFKRRSPSKGVILAGADPKRLSQSYQSGGAAAISVLTEEDYFDGSLEDLRKVKSAVDLPVLRKDFLFDAYQVYEAAANGADAILLIVGALDDDSLRNLRELAEDELGIDVLVEVHTSTEMERATKSGARVIGVNNRNLSTFKVRLETSLELAPMAPPDAVLVSESGLSNATDVKRLHSAGYNAFLIGETLMRSSAPANTLKSFLELAAV